MAWQGTRVQWWLSFSREEDHRIRTAVLAHVPVPVGGGPRSPEEARRWSAGESSGAHATVSMAGLVPRPDTLMEQLQPVRIETGRRSPVVPDAERGPR